MGVLDAPTHIADGADVAQGATSDASTALTVIGRLKKLITLLPTALGATGGLVVEGIASGVPQPVLLSSIKAEDSASADGDNGLPILVVRRDADTSAVSTDGDYSALLVDSIGRLKVKPVKDNQVVNGSLTIAGTTSVTATGGDSNNGVIDLTKKSLVGIQLPATWTAAALTFSASMDGGTTYNDLYDDTLTERSIAVVASRTITLDPTKFMGCTHIKFRSGTGATPVNQAAGRTIIYTTVAL